MTNNSVLFELQSSSGVVATLAPLAAAVAESFTFGHAAHRVSFIRDRLLHVVLVEHLEGDHVDVPADHHLAALDVGGHLYVCLCTHKRLYAAHLNASDIFCPAKNAFKNIN